MAKQRNLPAERKKAQEILDSFDPANGGSGKIYLENTADENVEVVINLQNEQGNPLKGFTVRQGEEFHALDQYPFHIYQASKDIIDRVAKGLVAFRTEEEAAAFSRRYNSMLDNEDTKKPEDNMIFDPSKGQLVPKQHTTPNGFEDIINPRVQNLLAKVSPRLPENERWPVRRALQEFIKLEDSLTIEDCNAIRAAGNYPTLIQEATLLRTKLIQGDSGEDEEPVVEVKPKARKAKATV